MPKIDINDQSLPLIKSGLELKKSGLAFKLKKYQKKLKEFEKQYNMSSEDFMKKFKAGQLGDEAYLLDWEYLIEAVKETKKQLEELEQVKI